MHRYTRREIAIASAFARPEPAVFDVAIVGAGVFGAWIAYECARAKKSVLLIDARGPANSFASSGGETRILRVCYGPQKAYSAWAEASLRKWRQLLEKVNQTKLFCPCGVLWMGQEGDAYLNACLTTLRERALAHHVMAAAELMKVYPQLRVPSSTIGILETDSGAILARRAVQLMVELAVKEGATYRQSTVAAPFNINGALRSLETTGGLRIAAREFIFACGPWLPGLFPKLVDRCMRITRQEVFFFGAPRGNSSYGCPRFPAWVDFSPTDIFYGIPDIEHRGFKVASDKHGKIIDPEREDRVVSQEGLASVREFLKRRFPGLSNAPLVGGVVCQYENTLSGDFIIDRHPSAPNVLLVGGGSGHGFKHGPAVGEYVASLLKGASLNPKFTLQAAYSSLSRDVH